MIHIHTTHRHLSRLPYKEARLCHGFENAAHANEIVSADREMQENPRMREVVTAYTERVNFHEDKLMLSKPANRAYFFALLMPEVLSSRRGFDGSARDVRLNYKESDKNRIRLYQPAPFKRFDVSTDAKKDELEASMSDEVKAEIAELAARYPARYMTMRPADIIVLEARELESDFRSGIPVTGRENMLRFVIAPPAGMTADAYVQQLNDAQAAYVANSRPDFGTHKELLDAQLNRYAAARKTLDDKLERAGVRGPGDEMRTQALPTNALTHAEYLQLLSLLWNGNPGELDRIFALPVTPEVPSKLGIIQDALRGRGNADALLLTTYTELTQRDLGTAETLNRFGMEIGTKVLMDYRAHRAAYAAGRQPTPEEGLAPLGNGEEASQWIQDPRKAFSFLQNRLPDTGPNARFLKALNFYANNGWRPAVTLEERNDVDGLDQDDVRALLNLIIQHLQERDAVYDRTNSQQRDLRKQMNFIDRFQQVELGKIWEFMTDIRGNPIGAIASWVLLIGAVKAAARFAKAERSAWINWLLIGGGVAAVYGLYQAKQTGQPWWNGVSRQFGDWKRRENELSPEQQTLPGYWHSRFQQQGIADRDPNGPTGRDVPELNQQKSIVCLSVISSQPVGKVTAFYEGMKNKAAGQRLEEADTSMMEWLPSGMRRQFGGMTSKQIAYLHFLTLERFFEERGRAAEQEVPPVLRRSVVRSDYGKAGIGLSYIKDKYVSKRYYSMIAVGLIVQYGITIEGTEQEFADRLGANDSTAWDYVRQRNPRVAAAIEQIRGLVISESRVLPTGDIDMAFIMAMEADPSSPMLRGTALASLLERIRMQAEGYGADAINIGGRQLNLAWDATRGWVASNGGDLVRWTGRQWEGVVNGVRGMFDGPPPPITPPVPMPVPSPDPSVPSVLPTGPGIPPALPGGVPDPLAVPDPLPAATGIVPAVPPGDVPDPLPDGVPDPISAAPRDPNLIIGELEAAEIVPGMPGMLFIRRPADPSAPGATYDIGIRSYRGAERGPEYLMTVRSDAFARFTTPQLVQAWKLNALTNATRGAKTLLERVDVSAFPVLTDVQPPWNLRMAAGDRVEYDAEVDGQRFTASTPFHIFIQHRPDEIAVAYMQWARFGAVGTTDPLNQPPNYPRPGTVVGGRRAPGTGPRPATPDIIPSPLPATVPDPMRPSVPPTVPDPMRPSVPAAVPDPLAPGATPVPDPLRPGVPPVVPDPMRPSVPAAVPDPLAPGATPVPDPLRPGVPPVVPDPLNPADPK